MAKARTYPVKMVDDFIAALDARIKAEMARGGSGAADRCKVLFSLKGVAEGAPSTLRKAVEPHAKRAVKLLEQAEELRVNASFYQEITGLVLNTFPAKEKGGDTTVEVDADSDDSASDDAADVFSGQS